MVSICPSPVVHPGSSSSMPKHYAHAARSYSVRSAEHLHLQAMQTPYSSYSSTASAFIHDWLLGFVYRQMSCLEIRRNDSTSGISPIWRPGSAKGNENSGSADWIVNGIEESCFSKTWRHFSCLKRGCESSNDQVMSLIFASPCVLGVQVWGALSWAPEYLAKKEWK